MFQLEASAARSSLRVAAECVSELAGPRCFRVVKGVR
jgi:hypothetical protein